MVKAEVELFEAACYVDRVIREPDAYIAADDIPELIKVRDKIRELRNRAVSREDDDLRSRVVG